MENACLYFESISSCLVCKSGYFSKEFATTAAKIRGFNPQACQSLSKEMPDVKEYFIANEGCHSPNGCDGSIDSPFGNFYDALKTGQIYSESLEASNITFSLITISENTQAEYFWSSEEENIYHFFRRVNVNLKISANAKN